MAKRADFKALGRKYSIDPVVARLIRNRDIITDKEFDEYLNGKVEEMADPFLMKDMSKAVAILQNKIADGAYIRIVGDYDIDGIMATYILNTGLKALGAHVDYTVPHRIKDGYGISEGIVRKAKEDGVDTIITCDNGISASAQMTLAKELGMTTIVTDHHDVVTVPDADAVVDPKQEDCPYPFKLLCGAAVAWKLLKALQCPVTDDLIEYAAFATIGDIVALKGENRTLVRAGFERLHHTANIGLLKLLEVNKLKAEDIRAYHVGFVLGPCLNASGRLSSALEAVRLLETEDEKEAESIATHMKSLNERRKEMTEEGVKQAEVQILAGDFSEDDIYVIYLPDCHESVAGIIAGRIREKYSHPVYVLTDGENCVKGSGRSIEKYSMIDGLKECADLLEKFGGHPLAAGISLKKENIEAFRKRLNEKSELTKEDFYNKIAIDMLMPMSYVTEELIDQMTLLEPYGQENPEPVFAMKDVHADSVRLVGKEGNVAKLRLTSADGYSFNAVCFRDAGGLVDRIQKSPIFSIVYYPTVNEFRGKRTIEAVVTHYR